MNNSPIDTEHKQYIFILTGVQRFEVGSVEFTVRYKPEFQVRGICVRRNRTCQRLSFPGIISATSMTDGKKRDAQDTLNARASLP